MEPSQGKCTGCDGELFRWEPSKLLPGHLTRACPYCGMRFVVRQPDRRPLRRKVPYKTVTYVIDDNGDYVDEDGRLPEWGYWKTPTLDQQVAR